MAKKGWFALKLVVMIHFLDVDIERMEGNVGWTKEDEAELQQK